MLKSLLIANRGEIACRIIRTARALGVRTIAVHSDADSHALHVREADSAVPIGPSPARESYLVGEKILAAARASGAEAIHPGYGFLSENADFAQAVLDAGLIWVGPSPASIRAMGLKDAAKARMIAAGVPVTPGYLGEDQRPERLQAEADAIGYPVLIKAVAGGGGKGMRRVDDAAAFADALASCQREAASSFGDDRVLLEKYILSPRHIEVQVFGDSHGNVVHLFERDCSFQRRHQKVIEEAPAPGMDAETRAAICAAAVRAAQAVDYVGAGTIEFIADGSEGLRADRIWFMEMNTRLQVEHPVSEAITGVDLVEWQLRVASGEPLPLQQDQLAIRGWAMEARLYAEDPANGFLPSVGALDVLRLPDNVRVETGVAEGDAVSPYYDPMIAKLVVHGDTRAEAIGALSRACGAVAVAPVKTNAWFLRRLLEPSGFWHGTHTTGFIPDHLLRLTRPPEPSAGLLSAAAAREIGRHVPEDGGGAFDRLPGFRLNAPRQRRVRLAINDAPMEAEQDPFLAEEYWRQAPHHPVDGLYFEAGATFRVGPFRPQAETAGSAGDGAIRAPMPGRVTAVEVSPGAAVAQGQRLVTLEAMKMEHALTAPFDGVVAELPVAAGDQVPVEALLVRVARE